MVKIVKSKPTFPNGVPGLKMKFPAWEAVPSIDQQTLKGVYRGDFLYFRYKAKDQNKAKKINSNPLIIFEGIDNNGNIVGTNLMFFNMFIDPKTGNKEVSDRYINSVIDTMKAVHWDSIYTTGKRESYIPFFKKNFPSIFGRTLGFEMQRFWRTYKVSDIASLSNITIDSALNILSTTKPTYIKSTKSIK